MYVFDVSVLVVDVGPSASDIDDHVSGAKSSFDCVFAFDSVVGNHVLSSSAVPLNCDALPLSRRTAIILLLNLTDCPVASINKDASCDELNWSRRVA